MTNELNLVFYMAITVFNHFKTGVGNPPDTGGHTNLQKPRMDRQKKLFLVPHDNNF